MKEVLLISGRERLEEAFSKRIFENFHVMHHCWTAEDGTEFLQGDVRPDIVIITKDVPSNTGMDAIGVALEVGKETPVTFLFGESLNLNNEEQQKEIWALIDHGITDLVFGNSTNAGELAQHLAHPFNHDDIVELLDTAKQKHDENAPINNLIAFYSVKPGSGKSFVALNTAVAIAKFGQLRSGQPPRVAIVDGDLNSLSIGSLLKVENKNYNLLTALKAAANVINQTGEHIGTPEGEKAAIDTISKCFVRPSQIPNLYALVASDISLEDHMSITSYHFQFVLHAIYSLFDIVIVDMNSSIEHITTGPIFSSARSIYFLMDQDMNNIYNNIRYMDELKELGVSSKLKYVMNKYISTSEQKDFKAKLDYNMRILKENGIDIVRTVPMVNPIIMNNRAMQGLPIVLDKVETTAPARLALIQLANLIWKIDQQRINEYLGRIENHDAVQMQKEEKFCFFTKLLRFFRRNKK